MSPVLVPCERVDKFHLNFPIASHRRGGKSYRRAQEWLVFHVVIEIEHIVRVHRCAEIQFFLAVS